MDTMDSKEIYSHRWTDSAMNPIKHDEQLDMMTRERDPEKADTNATPLEPLQKTITAQDWNGSEDHENPLNW